MNCWRFYSLINAARSRKRRMYEAMQDDAIGNAPRRRQTKDKGKPIRKMKGSELKDYANSREWPGLAMFEKMTTGLMTAV